MKTQMEKKTVADEESVKENPALDHQPALGKSFDLLSACATGIVTGNSWAVLGGGIVASLYNGGPPGVLYEFTAVSIFYCFIAASIAELASAIPASGGVYHWATVTAGPKYGRICGWLAGWLNGLAWMFAVASNSSMTSSMIVYAYSLYNPGYKYQRWHTFICYLVISWICCCTVMFAQRALPYISRLGSFFVIAGLLVTTVVCAVMPHQTGTGYASNEFVWAEWDNQTGYSSDGFVFLAGMLNGAFAVGAIDCVTHIAEEMPRAKTNIPIALGCQAVLGFVTGFAYLIALFYATNDLSAIVQHDSISPVGDFYRQATGSDAGAVGLLVVNIAPIFCATIGCYITASRTFHALGRDAATPFARWIGAVSPRWHSPLAATGACGLFLTGIGAIYVGSLTAFNAFIGSFVVLTAISYLLAVLPHLLTGRQKVRRGPFWMGNKVGVTVNIVACSYMAFSSVIYCFPYELPVTAESMNYTCVMACGLVILLSVWWLLYGSRIYRGPEIAF